MEKKVRCCNSSCGRRKSVREACADVYSSLGVGGTFYVSHMFVIFGFCPHISMKSEENNENVNVFFYFWVRRKVSICQNARCWAGLDMKLLKGTCLLNFRKQRSCFHLSPDPTDPDDMKSLRKLFQSEISLPRCGGEENLMGKLPSQHV